MQDLIEKNREKIIELCRRHHVQTLSVFGSAVRDDFDPARSDIDFLVEFEPNKDYRFAPNFFSLQNNLALILNRDVDLVIAGSVKNPVIRRNVEAQQQVFYAA